MDAAVPARARDLERAVAPVDQREALRVDEAAFEVLRDERDPAAIGRIARRLVVERRARGERAEAAAAKVERDDLVFVVEALVLGRIVGERDLAAVGSDVVMMCGRIGARHLIARAGEKVLHASRIHVDGEESRHAPIREPAVPPAVRRVLDDVGLHLVILPGAVAFRERGEGLFLRPHPREECDAARIGKPFRAEGAGGERGEPPRLAAIGRDEIDLRLLVGFLRADRRALGDERDRASVGRPARLCVLLARRREAARLAAERRIQPQARLRAVLLHVVGGNRNAGLRPIGGQRRLDRTLELPQGLHRHALLRHRSPPFALKKKRT